MLKMSPISSLEKRNLCWEQKQGIVISVTRLKEFQTMASFMVLTEDQISVFVNDTIM